MQIRKSRGKVRGFAMRMLTLVENTPGAACCGSEHGLSIYIETEHHKVLMDCGATDLFFRNGAALGIDFGQIDTVVLSHGHYDHGGGIPVFAAHNRHAKIYLRRSAGGAYYHDKGDALRYIGLADGITGLPQCVFTDGTLRLDDELLLFGDVRGTRFLSKDRRAMKRLDGDAFVQDPFDHEQCLVVSEGGRNILLSGCAHNGIVNILDRYRELFDGLPDAVIGGFHLIQNGDYTAADLEAIRAIGRVLRETDTVFHTGHCTGEVGYRVLKEIMGEQLHPLHSGTEIPL